jgi:uncharacterized repeat protein (TIGR01451 family)
MKNRVLLVFLFCGIFAKHTHAQITVNDPAFLAFLQQNYAGCMNGNQIIPQCQSMLDVLELDLSGLGISDLTGIGEFGALLRVDVSNNNLTELPLELFESLASYEFSGVLIANNNLLQSLPLQTSPFPYLTLDTLILSNNLFSTFSIDEVSGTMTPYIFIDTYLDLSNNQLISVMINNQTNLNQLDLSYNQLTSFTANGLSMLQTLKLSNNSISSFSQLNFFELYYLDLSYNNLTSFTDYANWDLWYLDLSNNQLTEIPFISQNMNVLKVNNNLIESFSNPEMLYYIMNELDCSNNQLSNLGNDYMYTSFNLTKLHCANNNITCLPFLGESISDLDFSNNPINCVPNIPPLLQNQLQNFPVCINDPFINPNNCNVYMAVTADVFDDQNSSCLKDNNEESVLFASIFLTDAQGDTINTVGSSVSNWILPYFGDGDFTAILDTLNKPYQASCGAQNLGASQDFTVYPGQTSVYLNFPVECKPGFDVGTSGLFPTGWVFPGQTHALTVMAGDMSEMYGLNCASGVAGTVSFTVNGPVSYVGPAPDALTPTSVNGLSFSYSIADFGNINSWSDFAVLLETDTTAQAGDAICVSINVTPTAGDNNAANNAYSYCYQVINSYDPNDKWVYPRLVLPGYDDYLTYTINFQNTGNAPAFNIRLEDTLATLLDLTSFEVVYFSHDMNYKIVNNKLTVYFPNIMLADSTTNEPESKGKFIYRVKPKSNLPLGTEIDNTCHIFFDFNAPIVTNTVTTLFDVSASLPSLESNWLLYPNPNSGSFYLSGMDYESIEIVDQTGREVEFTTVFETGRTQIELQNAAPGLYFVRCVNGTQVSVKRIYVH